MMKVRILKKHPAARMPVYNSQHAACFDLEVLRESGGVIVVPPGQQATFRTGLAFEVPQGWAMAIHSRSGQGLKHSVRLANGTGIIDPDYRGEVLVILRNDHDSKPYEVKPGDFIAQAMVIPAPRVFFFWADQLSETERGEGGFGSTTKPAAPPSEAHMREADSMFGVA